MNNFKILLVHNFYQSTHIGGEDLVFEQEKNALISALGAENVFTYTVSNDSLQTHKISKIKLIFNIFHNISHAKKIQVLIKEHNIHIMHVHNYFPLLTPSIFKAAKKAGAKVVYTLHNYREWCLSGVLYRADKPECFDCVKLKLPISGIKNACYRNSRVQSFLAGLAHFYYKVNKHLDYVDRFFILSETQEKVLQKIQTPILARAKIKPSFIDAAEGGRGTVLSAHKKNYLFVGRLESIKGIELLLEVWQNMDASYVLEIIGSGPSQIALEEKYKQPNIIFLGKLPRDQVLIKMAQAKYLIHPGLVQETQGLTILEALAQGTPVVGLDIGTRQEYIQDNHNGFLCKTIDLKGNIIKSEQLFRQQPERYEMLCKQAVLSSQRHLPSHITSKQLELYRAL